MSEADTTSFIPTVERPILITDKALEAIKKAISNEGQPGDGLRVAVAGGGCSGFQYTLDFEKAAREDDTVISFDGLAVFVDSVSVGLLTGTSIDFVSDQRGTGFKFNNPNVRRTCGCHSAH